METGDFFMEILDANEMLFYYAEGKAAYTGNATEETQ